MPIDSLFLVHALCCLVYPSRLVFSTAISVHYVIYPYWLLLRHQADLLVEWLALPRLATDPVLHLTSLRVLEPEHVAQEVQFGEVADGCQETTDEHEDELKGIDLRTRQVGDDHYYCQRVERQVDKET